MHCSPDYPAAPSPGRVLGLALALLALAAGPALAGGLPVAVSIPPQKYFLERIAGPLVETMVLVPPAADAHTYEPKPSQMHALAGARLFFAIGIDFEQAWLPRIVSASKGLRIVRCDAGIAKLAMPEHHGHGDHRPGAKNHDDDGLDPHVWVSPPEARIIVATMAEALAQTDPAHAATYRAGAAGLLREIDALDARIRALFAKAPPNAREFMVFHPAWGYFARAYGLTQVPVEVAGKSPGPRELARLIEHAKARNIKVVFAQPQFSDKSAAALARAIGGEVLKADPLAEDWVANLEAVAKAFASALR